MSEVTARRAWSYQFIRRAKTPPPSYGSREWLALANDDPRQVAACVVAAECWARGGDDIPGRLEREVAASREAFVRAENQDYKARANDHRQEWRKRLNGSTFVERRAAQLADAAPRPNDFTGTKGTGS